MKVMVVIGTRPEVIKMAPVISALRSASIDTLVCASGQHREMLAQALDVFSNPKRREQLKNRPNPYGDGQAAVRIAAILAGDIVHEFNG